MFQCREKEMGEKKLIEDDYNQEERVYVPVSVVDTWVKTIDKDIERLEDRRSVIEGIRLHHLKD